MKTLEQAIDYLMDASRSIAEVAESESDEANRINAQNVADDCKQIADLLKELQERRKEPEIIRCGECARRKTMCDGRDRCAVFNVFVDSDGYCKWAERKADG